LEKQLSQKQSQEALVLKCKDRYEQKSLELVQLQQFLKTAVPSKETDKIRSKAEKVYQQVRVSDQEYMQSTEKLHELHQNWKCDMMAACVDFQKLEEDRFHFLRGNIWKYANFLSSACVLNDEVRIVNKVF
jgi:16S rRNA C1402 N4-methylase RsmH